MTLGTFASVCVQISPAGSTLWGELPWSILDILQENQQHSDLDEHTPSFQKLFC